MDDLKIGLQLGYWGAGPDPKLVNIAQEAEKLGYDAVFTAEAWGSDVFTPLALALTRKRFAWEPGSRNCRLERRQPQRWRHSLSITSLAVE